MPKNLQRFGQNENFIFDESGNLIGIRNPNSKGADLDVSSLVSGAGVPGVYNITPTNLMRAQAAFLKVMNGTRGGQSVFNAVWLRIGDSIERDTNGGVPAGSGTGGAAAAPSRVIAKSLRDRGIPAYNNSSFGNTSLAAVTPANFSLFEPAMVFTGTPISTPIGSPVNMSLGGNLWNFTAAGQAQFTPPEQQCDTFDWYALSNTGFGTINININAGADTPVNLATAPSTFLKSTVSSTLGANTSNFKWASGNVYMNGVVARNSAVPEISILNVAAASSDTGHWTASTLYYQAFNCIQLMAPALTTIALGVNDSKTTAGGVPKYTIAQYKAMLGSLIDKAAITGDVLGKTQTPISTSLGSLPTDFALQQSYADAAIEVFLAKGIPYIDNFRRFRSYELASVAPYNFFESGEYVHFNAYGEVFSSLPETQLAAWLVGK